MAHPYSVTYEKIEEAANFVLGKIPEKPKIGIICGRGLESLPDMFAEKIDISYTEIPNYPECKVHGNSAMLTYGTVDGLPVVCFRGRFHFHEGYAPSVTVLPVRLLKLMGAKLIILTNAGGGINPDYKIGDIMLLKDHVNLVAFSDTQMADDRWGAPNKAVRYDSNLREKAKQAFSKAGVEATVYEGIYACSAGSRFHSVAEIALLKQLGCDVVGTSLAHEALTARNCGMEVLGLSVIHRLCSCDYDSENKQEDVNGVPLLQPFVDQYIKDLAPDLKPPPEETPTEEPPIEEAPPEEPEATEEAPPEEPAAPEEPPPPEPEGPTKAPSQEVPPEGTSAKPSVTEKPSEPGPPAPEGPKKKKACECKGKKKEGQEGPSTGSAVASKASMARPPVESKKSQEGPPKEDEQRKKKRSCECKNNPLRQQETKEEEKKETKVEEPKEEEKKETQEEETKEEEKKEEQTVEETEEDNKEEENKGEEGA